MHVSRSVVGSQDAGCVGVLAFGSADPIWRPVGIPRVNHCIAHMHPCIVSIKAEGGNQGFTQGPRGGGVRAAGKGRWLETPLPRGMGGPGKAGPGMGFGEARKIFLENALGRPNFVPLQAGWVGV